MVKNSGASLKTVNRALDVLLLFNEEHPEWSVAELSQALGLHRSVVYRILCTFEQRGVVTKSHTGGRYRLGLKLVELANVVLASMDLRQVVHPVMERLVRETGESAFLTIVSEDESVCIHKKARNGFVSPSPSAGATLSTLALRTNSFLPTCLQRKPMRLWHEVWSNLEDRLRVPVIDPVLSGGLIAHYAAVGNEAMR